MTQNRSYGILSIPVIVGALGYFVDIYDLLLFGIVRRQSLMDLGLRGDELVTVGENIISWQMAGLLIGGIIWGIMGDRKGRRSVLFGSILMYSLANIANGMITTTGQYAAVRFIAGIGLAGELGAGITLVAELLPKEKRGIATSLVAGLGLTGAVVAYFVSQSFDWRLCYYIGGALGLLLLFLRVSVFESGMFEAAKEARVQKGNLLMFFNKGERFKKYLLSILIGLPTWYVIGVLVTFSDQFAQYFGITEPVSPGKAIMYAYAGISLGDIAIGFVSQGLRSRKKALYIFYALTAISVLLFFNQDGGSAANMYWICAAMGFATGFWAIFVTMAAEQFGTNLRATAATTVPNVVRGSLPLIIVLFKSLRGSMDYASAALVTGSIVMAIAVVAAILSKETFGKDLNFLEH
ncbi:MFS transporter [Paracnuella aquatica]|uniref:MFS transporter n=1 Tax=Paracnuella aquatica TaxID=2268757 RepID=UPI000DEED185|nr:MFS transporter [Paracnuella aquatica]RPD43631.1 MFS transporter [Paracnuella aquatica]